MKFVSLVNKKFRWLSLMASVIGLYYLVSRRADFALYYQFMDQRHHKQFSLQVAFPLLVFFIDCVFVLEQIFFSLVNWKYVLPAGAPSASDPEIFVTLLIPSYDEPVSVVSETVEAALNLDYPRSKYEILLLDDQGSDEKFRLIEKLRNGFNGSNLRYESRVKRALPESLSRKGFKAGNLNYGISLAHVETRAFALLDADHLCRPEMLKSLVPYTLDERGRWNPQFGFVQGPQTYRTFHVDPWDRPCREFHTVTQGYRAYRNGVMLTGTSALVSAAALKDVGGFDESTVTEDIITGAKIHGKGYAGFYHPQEVAHGLVPETLVSILRQRLRWAQGSFQLLKKGGRFGYGLSWGQQFTYISGVVYFFMGFAYLALALLPALVLGLNYDGSLHYSDQSLAALGGFIVLRYWSRDTYCRKSLTEKAAGNYLGLVFAPVYIFAFFSAFLRTSLKFQTTPKSHGPTKISPVDFFFQATPFVVALVNLGAVIRIITFAVAGGYPGLSFVTDYLGITTLALYFVVCGLAPQWVPASLKLAPLCVDKGEWEHINH